MPDTAAFDVEAALLEFPLKIYLSTPSNFKTIFIHLEFVEEISLYGLMVPSKSWV